MRLPDGDVTEPGGDAGDARLVQALDALATVQLELHREQLRAGEATDLLDRLLGAMSDALVVVDALGVVTRVNDAALRLFGRTRADVEGKHVRRVLGSEAPTSSWKLLEREPTGKLHLELTLPGAAGDVPVALSCSVIRDATGKVVGTLYLARDLTETHRLLGEVTSARARWRLLAEIGEELTDSVAPEESLAAVCQRVSEETGCGMAVLLVAGSVVERVFMDPASEASETLPVKADQPLEQRSALASVLRDGRVLHAPSLPPAYPLLGSSATNGMASAAVAPISAKGSCLGAALLFSDRPDGVDSSTVHLLEEVARRIGLVLANARLRASLADFQAAHEVARAREEILAGLSHDMKTPLAVLVGGLDVLRSSGDRVAPDRKRMLYEAMFSQAHRLRRLVLQFLDYTRMESGHPLAADPCPTDIGGAIRKVVETFDAPCEIEVEINGHLPPVLVDPDRFDQVLSNLLSNAAKFSPPRSRVTVAAREAGNRVEVAVIDRGRGIAPKDLANLFDKYYRGRNVEGSPGTGLGLYMSRALMEAQGGSITVASRLGHGSTFTVVLPVATREHEQVI